MKIERYTCVKQTYNPHMGMECWSTPTCIFYIDTKNWVKVGDVVECERCESGFYRRIWVNGELKTEDNFADIHGEMFKRTKANLENETIEERKNKLIAYVYKGEVYHANKEWSIERCKSVLRRLGATYWEILC